MPDEPSAKSKASSETDARRFARHSAAANEQVAPGAAFRVVAIGASAGGLEACKRLLDALPSPTGMAFILVQHLDPTHRSLLVDLLAEHSALTVVQAAEGMPVELEHLYVIPPGSYLSVNAGALHLSPSKMRDGAPHGARLPFDALLHSMAEKYGRRAACVVLSGTGGDGSVGLRAVKEAGGLVIAQEPGEADYDGMPRSAIATGLVDAILQLAGIPGALAAPASQGPATPPPAEAGPPPSAAATGSDPVSDIIALLYARNGHDFAPYKRGTLERRIERRMGLASLGGNLGRYLDLLRTDMSELDQLARDLLIHVTRFFREPAVFDALAALIPAMLQDWTPNDPVRVWIAGCSTGEEAYSLVMLFREAIAAAQGGPGKPDVKRPDIKLQVFASDIDANAVEVGRAGLYPIGISVDVSAERLARFFNKEDDHGYRVHPDLRASVVFTVQDLLVDPPFSRLDLVSCRNLMAQKECRQLEKPVKSGDLLRLIGEMLPGAPAPVFPSNVPRPPGATSGSEAGTATAVIFVVDDDSNIRAMLRAVLEDDGDLVEDYGSGEAFLAAFRPGREGCLVADAAMPGLGGLEVLQRLGAAGHRLPAIVVTGHGDVAMAVTAMKAGAVGFIEKPVGAPDLLAAVGRALDQSRDAGERSAWQAAAARSIAALTPRQRDVMARVLAGHPSKNIAADLDISQRTVENHRASIMQKTGARSLPALARLALAAAAS